MPLSFLKVPAPIHRMARALRLDADWQLVVAAGVVGIVVGALALGFILPIRAIEAALEHAIVASRTEGAMLVVIAPVLGAIGTAAVYALIPMSFRGHGVTQVLYAVNRTRSRIPLRVAVRQWLASTCTISSGGSAGPEGPIVTIGATLGSNAARLLGASDAAATTTLLGCGAAAGLSAVFAAPLTGSMETADTPGSFLNFSVQNLMHDSQWSFAMRNEVVVIGVWVTWTSGGP